MKKTVENEEIVQRTLGERQEGFLKVTCVGDLELPELASIEVLVIEPVFRVVIN